MKSLLDLRPIRSAPRSIGLLACLMALSACDENEKKPAPTSPEPTEGSLKQPAAEAKPGEKAPASTGSSSPAEAAKSACPSGRWLYDYGDNALEAMVSQMPGAKLTREEGSFICTLDDGTSGKVSCRADAGKPVINEISTDQAGMPLVVLVKITGGTTSQFKLNDDGTMTMSNTDMSDFEVEATATIAGKSVPFPAKELALAFAPENTSTKVAYKCEGDTLKLLPQVEGSTVWQELKRVP